MLSTCCFFHTATCVLLMVILRVLLLDLLHVFLTPVHSETISIKKFKHYSFVECDDTYFPHIVSFHTATGALVMVILIVLLLDLLYVFLTPAHSETIPIKKFKHDSFVECDDTYFQHIVFFILLLVHLLQSSVDA